MDITLSNLIHHSGQNFVILSPIVKEIAGSENAAKIITKLEYWFSKYHNGFYKFLEPCATPLCRAGDTWSEEVGLTRKVFNKAFDHLGIRYSSKTTFLKSSDTFQGKMYASYYDRKANRMYYVRNHAMVQDIFQKFMDRMSAKKTPKAASRATDLSSSGRSSNDQKGRSFVSASKILPLQINTNKPLSPQIQATENPESVDEGVIKKIIKIWQDYLPAHMHPAKLSPTTQRNILNLVKTELNNDLDKWQNMCREISSNDFLLGKTSTKGWQINFDWLAKPDNFGKIMQGNYGINPDKIMHVAHKEEDIIRKIDREESNPEVADLKKRILQRAGAPSYKSWFDTAVINWIEAEGVFIISSVTTFWKSYVDNHFRWLKELGLAIEIKTC